MNDFFSDRLPYAANAVNMIAFGGWTWAVVLTSVFMGEVPELLGLVFLVDGNPIGGLLFFWFPCLMWLWSLRNHRAAKRRAREQWERQQREQREWERQQQWAQPEQQQNYQPPVPRPRDP